MSTPFYLYFSGGVAGVVPFGESKFTSLSEPKSVFGDVDVSTRGPQQTFNLGAGFSGNAGNNGYQVGGYVSSSLTPLTADLKDSTPEAILISRFAQRLFGFGVEGNYIFDGGDISPVLGISMGFGVSKLVSSGDKLPTAFSVKEGDNEGYPINSYGAGLPLITDSENSQSWMGQAEVALKPGIEFSIGKLPTFRFSGILGFNTSPVPLAPQPNGATHQIIDSDGSETQTIDSRFEGNSGLKAGIEIGVRLGKRREAVKVPEVKPAETSISAAFIFSDIFTQIGSAETDVKTAVDAIKNATEFNSGTAEEREKVGNAFDSLFVNVAKARDYKNSFLNNIYFKELDSSSKGAINSIYSQIVKADFEDLRTKFTEEKMKEWAKENKVEDEVAGHLTQFAQLVLAVNESQNKEIFIDKLGLTDPELKTKVATQFALIFANWEVAKNKAVKAPLTLKTKITQLLEI